MKNFAGINFRESTFSEVKKGIYFREFSRNSRNFLLPKFLPLRYLAVFSTYGPFRIAYLPKIMIFWSKPLKIEYVLKSRVYLRFRSNFHKTLVLLIQIGRKNKISTNFKFWPPTKKSRFPQFSQFFNKISWSGIHNGALFDQKSA